MTSRLKLLRDAPISSVVHDALVRAHARAARARSLRSKYSDASEASAVSDTADLVWLEGCLLARDRRRDRLLIAFTDTDLAPVWLPAAGLRIEFYEGHYNWAVIRLTRTLAGERRQRFRDRLEERQERTAQRATTPAAPRRPKIFNPPKPKPQRPAQPPRLEPF
jgi:hypothetical protein